MKTEKTYSTARVKGLPALSLNPVNDLGEVVAMVSIFRTVDLQGDRVLPGAFSKSLADWRASGSPIPVVWSHSWSDASFDRSLNLSVGARIGGLAGGHDWYGESCASDREAVLSLCPRNWKPHVWEAFTEIEAQALLDDRRFRQAARWLAGSLVEQEHVAMPGEEVVAIINEAFAAFDLEHGEV